VETLYPVKLPPGLYKNGTTYEGRQRWINANLIRWHDGTIRPIGGWQLAQDLNGQQIQATGKPRGSLSWRKNDSTAWLGLGTTGPSSKLYALNLGTLTDITPAGLTNGTADGSVAAGGLGYGLGGYGVTPYGGGITAGTILDADTWSLDNFGEILLACLTADGKIYESTPTAQATQVTNSPTGCRAVCVTPERFVFALGASSDPRNVAWCSQSNRTLWAPAASNSAGSFPLQTAGRLMAGRRTDRETLLWTDADLWSAVYVGGNLIYNFVRRGQSCGLIGPNALTVAEGAAYWMSEGQFFVYDGAVRPIPCEVSDAVFSDLSRVQKAKITAWANVPFGEVWWHYPTASQGGLENDKVVVLNYRNLTWMTHTFARASGSPEVFANPQLWAPDGRLYAHESGMDHSGTGAFIESGPLELGEGDRVLRIQSLIPDEKTLGQVRAKFYRAFQPMGTETLSGAYTLSSRTDIRETGRQFRVRFEEPFNQNITFDSTLVRWDSTALTFDGGPLVGADFRIGTFRVGYLPAGLR
jgi:hypothetical protein